MPITYRIDNAKRTIHTKCFGNVTASEVADHFQALERHPECPDSLDVLLDLSEATSVPESNQLRDVTAEIRRIRETVWFGNCAIIACTNVLFGMSRMFEVFAQPYFREIRAFRALDEAQAWLTSRESLSQSQSGDAG